MKKILVYFSLLLGIGMSTGCNVSDDATQSSTPSCPEQGSEFRCGLENFSDTVYYEVIRNADSSRDGYSIFQYRKTKSLLKIYPVDKEKNLFGIIIDRQTRIIPFTQYPETTFVDTMIHDTLPFDSIGQKLFYSAEEIKEYEVRHFDALPDSANTVYSHYWTMPTGIRGSCIFETEVDENGFLIYSYFYWPSSGNESIRSLNAWHAPLIAQLQR